MYLQVLFSLLSFLGHGLAQDLQMTQGTHTDAKTGITFTTWTATQPDGGSSATLAGTGAFTFGLVLPADAGSANETEYIGYMRCQSVSANSTGWCGISHAGHMTNDLLLMAWPYQNQVLTSFRFIGDYFMPPVYNGSNATATPISSNVNSTGFEVIYRCQGCFSWQEGSYNESVPTAVGGNLFGFAQAGPAPQNPGCPGQITFAFHDNGYALWYAQLGNTTSPSYTKWAALPTQNVKSTCAAAASYRGRRGYPVLGAARRNVGFS